MEKYKERKWSGQKGKKFGTVGRLDDPYELPEGKEAAYCQQCHVVYQNKGWFFDEKIYNQLKSSAQAQEVVCPTCRKIKDRYPQGYLTLSGEFFVQHKDEILKVLEKEASRVAARSFDDRIIQLVPEGEGKLVVETTTEKLAQHLGRAVHKAYKGDLTFQWGEVNKFVRVYWIR
jgi:NMD protein affecting ribosome stability and mRNA decay